MRQLGLKLIRVRRTALAACVGSLSVAASCTRAANQEPVPPSSSVQSSAVAAPSALPVDAGASSRAAPPAGRVFDDSARTIEAKVGERFTINLPANITTPYKWVVASPETVVALAERHYDDTQNSKCDGCAGRSGTDRLTFEAKQDGTATLVLRYAPLRSKTEPPARELSIQVTVSK